MKTKTDRQLQEDVTAELAWDPAVESSRVGVESESGIITLSGHVGSYAEKCAAEHAAQRVSGGKDVVKDLTVVLPGSTQRTGEDIARSASAALEWSVSVPRERIKVRVEDGWVTLSRDVDWACARDAADSCVRSLIGIKGLINALEIRPQATPKDVKARIEAALQRRAYSDTKSIDVSIKDGTVTLCGFVDSLTERSTMEHAAWNAPGVRNVIDHLVVG